MEYLIAVICGIVIGVLVIMMIKRNAQPATTITIQDSIERFKDVGELVVFKVVSRQIVTAETHSWGKFAKAWLTALMSTKKMALIIEYGIDFKYNLRDAGLSISSNDEGITHITMPPCQWELVVRDIKFYDESNARILPWLLGDIGSAIGPGFGEEEKNKLLEEARTQAQSQADDMIEQFIHEVQRSATLTMEGLARSFGNDQVEVTFTEQIDKTPHRVEISEEATQTTA